MQAGAVHIKLMADIMDLQAKMQRAESLVGGAAKNIKSLLGGAFGAFSTQAFVGKLVDVQREFDKLNSSLITVTGSSANAAREMAWLKEFAKTTPYGLAQATEGFVKMKALGLNPTRAALTSFGNTASAMGKDLNQMIEAVADASSSQFERLREFGITAKQQGDKVSLTFQGLTTTIGNNAAEITRYLEAIGNNQFAGASAERAKTLDGAIAALGDTWDELFRTISTNNAGGLIYDSVTLATKAIEDATTIISTMTSAADDNAKATGALALAQEGLAITFEAIAVAVVNTKYVLVSMYREVAGIIKQFSALGEGGGIFSAEGRAAWTAAGKAMTDEAVRARAEVDATTARILGARKAAEELAKWNTRNASAATDPRRLDLITQTNTATTTATKLSKAHADALKAAAKAMAEWEKEVYDAAVAQQDTATKAVDSLQQQLDKEQERLAQFGLSQTAIADLEAAKLSDLATDKERLGAVADLIDFSGKMGDRYREEARLLRELGAAKQAYAGKQAAQESEKAAQKAAEELRDANEKAAKDAAEQWQKSIDQIGQSLADAIMNGGKSAGEYLRDYFRTLVLRPMVQALVNPVAAAGLGALGFAGSASAASSVPTLVNIAGMTSAASGAFSAGMASAFAGPAAAMETASAGLTMLTGANGMSSAISGLSQTIGAVAPYALALTAGVKVLSGLMGGNFVSTSGTGEASRTYNASGRVIGTTAYAPWGGMSQSADQVISGLAKQYFGTAAALGIQATQATFAYGGNTGRQGQNPNFGISVSAGGASYNTGETAYSDAALQLAASRAVLTALQGSELPKHLISVFDSITAASASQEQITAAITYAQQLTAIRSALLETRTPLQIATDQMAAMGTSAETFRADFVAAIDAGIGPEALAQWQNLGAAMEQVGLNAQTAQVAVESVAEAYARLTSVTKSNEDIAKERISLEQELASLTDTAAQALQRQRDALDESNRGLFDQIQAIKDKTAADEAAAQAAAELARVNQGWQDQLDVLTGKETERSIALRDATDDSTRALMRQVYAQQDAKSAAEQTAAALANTLADALNQARAAQEAYSRTLATARSRYDSAVNAVLSAEQRVADLRFETLRKTEQAAYDAALQMRNLGQTLSDFVSGKTMTSDQTFAATLKKALAGDADAMAALPNAATGAIDAAELQASSRTDYMLQRSRILVDVAQLAARAAATELPALTAAPDPLTEATQALATARADMALMLQTLEKISANTQGLSAAVINGFDAIDTNLDGKLTLAELLGAGLASDSAMTNLFNLMDTDNNGILTKLEAIRLNTLLTAENIGASVSNAVNTANTATVTPSEMSLAGFTDALKASAAAQGVNQSLITASFANGLFGSLDTNGSGGLSATEAPAATISARVAELLAPTTPSAGGSTGTTTTPTLSAFDQARMADPNYAIGTPVTAGEKFAYQFFNTKGWKYMEQFVMDAWEDLYNHHIKNGATLAQMPALFEQNWQANPTFSKMVDAASARQAYIDYHVGTGMTAYGAGLMADKLLFATGGVFSNKIVTRPTDFQMGQMGEAGPEAIMPLANINGSLGVRFAGNSANDALVAEIKALRAEVQALRAEARATASNTGKTKRLLERVTRDGDAMQTVSA